MALTDFPRDVSCTGCENGVRVIHQPNHPDADAQGNISAWCDCEQATWWTAYHAREDEDRVARWFDLPPLDVAPCCLPNPAGLGYQICELSNMNYGRVLRPICREPSLIAALEQAQEEALACRDTFYTIVVVGHAGRMIGRFSTNRMGYKEPRTHFTVLPLHYPALTMAEVDLAGVSLSGGIPISEQQAADDRQIAQFVDDAYRAHRQAEWERRQDPFRRGVPFQVTLRQAAA